MATVASVLVVGVMMIIAGVVEVFSAFQIKSWGKFLLWVLLVCSSSLPASSRSRVRASRRGAYPHSRRIVLAVSGIMRIILGFSMKREAPWIWVVLSGVITLLLGLRSWLAGRYRVLYILGLFLGIDLVMAGAGSIGLGFGLRRSR